MKYSIATKDVINGLKTAVFTAIFTALYSITLQPGFSVFTADWAQIGVNMTDIGVLAFMGYVSRKFFENKKGQILKK